VTPLTPASVWGELTYFCPLTIANLAKLAAVAGAPHVGRIDGSPSTSG
jgi:hypothetical protein